MGRAEEVPNRAMMRQGEGLRHYYLSHVHDLLLQLRVHSLHRLEAQRNDLNSKVRMLQEPGLYVGEVVKVMGKTKVLAKVHLEGKYVVDLDKSIDINTIAPTTRAALRNDSYARVESGNGSGDSEVQRTMLELLNQLDGFEASNKIKVLLATNRSDILDQALLGPGQIDQKIEFPKPTEESRLDILKIHSRKMNLMRGIDLKKIAEKMGGSSGAELKAVCTEAGMFALRERRVHVTQEHFEMAVAKVMKKKTDKNMSPKKLWK